MVGQLCSVAAVARACKPIDHHDPSTKNSGSNFAIARSAGGGVFRVSVRGGRIGGAAGKNALIYSRLLIYDPRGEVPSLLRLAVSEDGREKRFL